MERNEGETMNVDIVVIGGGASGLAAALSAKDDYNSVLVLEREHVLGGILNQCIHNGFGLHVFREELTGPEYASRFIEKFNEQKIDYKLDTTVLSINKPKDSFIIEAYNTDDGPLMIQAKAVILSSGCYERTRGQIKLPGARVAGIMPAGSAQRYLNIDGYLVGKDVFILGSGDIGLIMARRMTLEGAKVHGVAELMPYSNGLTRNIVQCLHDFDIPLYLSHTVTDIKGDKRLEEITIQEVDKDYQPIPGTEKKFNVDTLLLSVGLVPDTMVFESLDLDLSPITNGAVVDHTYQSNIPGIFACGNALHVHDLVDWVTIESEKAGASAKRYVAGEIKDKRQLLPINALDGIRYTVPQFIDMNNYKDSVTVMFRVTNKHDLGTFTVKQGDTIIQQKKARFIAPAEMESLMIKPDQLIDHETPITIELEVRE